MACSTKAGPVIAIRYIENMADATISQSDWHSLRVLAQRDECGTGSRAVATGKQIDDTLANLSNAVADAGYHHDLDADGYPTELVIDYLYPTDYEYERLTHRSRELVDTSQQVAIDIKKSRITVGSLEVLDYLHSMGIEEALDRARVETSLREIRQSLPRMSDKALIRRNNDENAEWVRLSGPLGVAGHKRDQIQQTLKVINVEMSRRNLNVTPVELDRERELALNALDKKVNKERKKMGLPSLNLDSASH